MLKIEYDLLKYIQKHQPVSYADLLNGFCSETGIAVSEADDILQCLIEDHHLDIKDPAKDRHSASFRLPSRTTQRLYQYDQERSEQARQEKNQRQYAYIGAFFTVLGTVIGAILTFLFSRLS